MSVTCFVYGCKKLGERFVVCLKVEDILPPMPQDVRRNQVVDMDQRPTPRPDNIMPVKSDDTLEPDLGPKSFGPKAIFTAGLLGNYEPESRQQAGPGEGGEAVHTTMAEKDAADRSIHEFGFNMVASDKIAMNRTIPDSRMSECKYWRYPQVRERNLINEFYPLSLSLFCVISVQFQELVFLPHSIRCLV